MRYAIGIGQRFAERHVAAALAVNQHAVCGGVPQAALIARITREASGMQLRITAGEEDGVGAVVGRFVGQR